MYTIIAACDLQDSRRDKAAEQINQICAGSDSMLTTATSASMKVKSRFPGVSHNAHCPKFTELRPHSVSGLSSDNMHPVNA